MLHTRLFFGLLIFVFCFTSSASRGKLNKDFFKPITETENPLSKFSNEWADTKYLTCNTAKNSPFLSKSEKYGSHYAQIYNNIYLFLSIFL